MKPDNIKVSLGVILTPITGVLCADYMDVQRLLDFLIPKGFTYFPDACDSVTSHLTTLYPQFIGLCPPSSNPTNREIIITQWINKLKQIHGDRFIIPSIKPNV